MYARQMPSLFKMFGDFGHLQAWPWALLCLMLLAIAHSPFCFLPGKIRRWVPSVQVFGVTYLWKLPPTFETRGTAVTAESGPDRTLFTPIVELPEQVSTEVHASLTWGGECELTVALESYWFLWGNQKDAHQPNLKMGIRGQTSQKSVYQPELNPNKITLRHNLYSVS